MGNSKCGGRIARGFSKSISWIFYFLLFLFLIVLGVVWGLDKKNLASICLLCFLQKWKTTFLTSSICIWGFTLTCVIFLMERLEEIYYGTSLKRIIIMCFGKAAVIAYVVVYILLIPFIVITYYNRMLLTNLWLQTVNYLYSAGFVVFVVSISLRDCVIELIRDRTVRQVKRKHFSQKLYREEQFAVLNMARNLDYDDMWQSSRLQSIIVDMVMAGIEKDRLYVIYNVVYLMIQKSGYGTVEQKNRTVNVLKDIIEDIIKKGKEERIDDEKLEEAVVEVIIPIFQVNLEETNGKWLKQIIGVLSYEVQRRVCIQLLFGAQYLYDCEVFCKLTVDELLDICQKLELEKGVKDEKRDAVEKAARKHWVNWNLFNHQSMKNDEICEIYLRDFFHINNRICEAEILLELQIRKLEYEHY